MDVLVTGGGGYIGSHVVEELVRNGHSVRVLDKFIWGRESLAPFADQIDIVDGDVRHIDDISNAVRGMDAVVHLAGIVGDPACSIDEEATKLVNVEATKALVNACHNHEVDRLVFASTCSVYGDNDQVPVHEGSRVNPLSLYAQTKLDSEQLILSNNSHLSRDKAFTPTVLRLATVYGWSRRMRFDLVVNILSAKGHLEGTIPIYGGDQYRPLVHVNDAARAFVTTIESPESTVSNEVFNVGSNEQNYRIDEVGSIISDHIPEAEVVYPDVKEDDRSYRGNFTKVSTNLDWTARRTIGEAVDTIREKIDEHGITDYSAPKYRNNEYPYGDELRN